MVINMESAKGKESCLLFIEGVPYIRIYDRSNNQFSYKDYKLCADDLTFRIDSDYYCLVEYSDGTKKLKYKYGLID